MSAGTPIPVLEVLDAEPVGSCEPGSDYCEVPGPQPEAPESTDKTAPAVDNAET